VCSYDLYQIENIEVRFGEVDITVYREDLEGVTAEPTLNKADTSAVIKNKTHILVDDVLYTGRPVRAAMDALVDIDRPSQIQLAVLIDRGHRNYQLEQTMLERIFRLLEKKSLWSL